MSNQSLTGVFVRLPLTNEQLGKLLAPTGTLNERLISIGTPVTGGELEKLGTARLITNNEIGDMTANDLIDLMEDML